MLHARAAQAADIIEAAVHSLEVAHEHYPKDTKILQQLAEMYAANEQTSEAKACYEKILAQRPNDPEALKNLKNASALDTMRKGRWEEEGDYRSKLKDEDESKRLEQSSRAVKTGGDIDALIAEAEAKIEKEPENLNLYRSLANLLEKAKRLDEAIEVMDKANKMTGGGDPQIDRAMSNLRVIKFNEEIKALEDAGDTAGAEARQQEKQKFLLQDAEARVKRYPNDLLFKFEYGELLFNEGRIDEAIQQFQPAQRQPQKRTQVLYYLARCFEQKEQYDIAAQQLESAAAEMYTMDDKKKDVIYELGLIYEKMGDLDKAVEYFKQIYAVDIGYREVAQKIENAYKKKDG